MVTPDELYSDESFEEMFPEAEIITIAELKYAYTDKFRYDASDNSGLDNNGVNSGWNNTKSLLIGEDAFVGHDVYIKGKVVSDDNEGNIYKSLYIQDETSGIELKLNNNVSVKYKKGRWVYVRLTGLYLGNYRMMLSLGGAPSESYNKVPEHKYYANSNLELQSQIDQHVFAGQSAGELQVGDYYEWKRSPVSVDIITVTPDNYVDVFTPDMVALPGKFYGTANEKGDKYFKMPQRELMFGRLMRFEDLECHYAGVPSFEFDENGSVVYGPVDKNNDGVNDLNENGHQILEPVVYVNPGLKSGSFENIYPSWLYTDPRPTVSKPWYHWAFKEEVTGRSLYGSVCFTYNPDATVCSENGVYALRTSGYSRFARQNVCRDREVATITAIYGIYAQKSTYAGNADDYASYQLTVSSINDIVFDNGNDAFLTNEQIDYLAKYWYDLKINELDKPEKPGDIYYVPWMDETDEMVD